MITNGIELNKTRSTGVNSACFIAVVLHKELQKIQRTCLRESEVHGERLAIHQNMLEFIELIKL